MEQEEGNIDEEHLEHLMIVLVLLLLLLLNLSRFLPAQLISPSERSGSLCLRDAHLSKQDEVNLLKRSVYISISVFAEYIILKTW